MTPVRTAPDNTMSSLIIILLIATALAVGAMLMGLSDKPELSAIGVSLTPDELAELADARVAATDDEIADELGGQGLATSASDDFSDATTGSDASARTTDAAIVELDELGNPIVDDPGTAASEASPTATAITIVVPTSTPEVAAAVEPTLIPGSEQAESTTTDDSGDTADGGDAAAEATEAFEVPSAAVRTGTITGTFFTAADEDDGATVNRNEIAVTINEDGTGSFTGVLDMVLVDETHITVEMAGSILWGTDSPQVIAELGGTYVLDSPIDADDVLTETGELTITSLASGSGSLCTPRCFGFTFPPATGF